MCTRKAIAAVCLSIWMLLGVLCGSAWAYDKLAIAVTDLTYENAVQHYFSFDQTQSQSNTQGAAGLVSGTTSGSHAAGTGEITQITRGELHKFTGDIRGALLKSGTYRLVQGRPWTQSDTTSIPATCMPPQCDGRPSTFSEQVTIYDIIDRIKKGYFAGADFVLFGTITSIESRREAMPIQATTAVNNTLSMELMAEFSLINTSNYEIVAGFSALGEGSDARLVNTPGAVISLSRGKVMQAVSRSLGDAVVGEIQTQFAPSSGVGMRGNEVIKDQTGAPPAVIEYR